ncbi:MAG: hypothetical protein HZB50_09895 [Chloroflexi bacterium]|nr:hypothetical protein [Chloroflexota bacterium]
MEKNNLCGAVVFAALFHTQNPSFTGNQIIEMLNNANIPTDLTGHGDIEKMASYFGWKAKGTDAAGLALTLKGNSEKRFNALLGYVNQGWIPVIGMKTNGGKIELTGSTQHWVAVVGIGESDDGRFIDIFNPYDDSVTRYLWDIFYESLSINWYAKGDNHTYDYNALVLLGLPSQTIEPRPAPKNNQPVPY